MMADEYWPVYKSICREKVCMIIGSFGAEHDPSVNAVPKESPSTCEDEIQAQVQELRRGPIYQSGEKKAAFLPGVGKDWDIMQDHFRRSRWCNLVYACPDFPGNQRPKSFYLERMEALLRDCEKEGVMIWYSGHGQAGTGNWCFKDGVISFQDVYDLYKKHFLGKVLVVVSDCCYAGNWVHDCAKMLDLMGIPACGHKAKDESILLKVYTSCQPDQKAADPCYSLAVKGLEDGAIWFLYGDSISPTQTTCCRDFTRILCFADPEEKCKLHELPVKWTWQDVASGNRSKLIQQRVQTVNTTTQEGRPFWHYIFLHEGKEAVDPENISVYGYVLRSGYGENPPDAVRNEVEQP